MTNDETGRPVLGQHRTDAGTRWPQGRRGDVVVMLDACDAESVLDAVKQRVPLLLDPPPAAVVVDLSGMARLTSGAVAALLWTGAACRRRGVPVRVRHVPPRGAAALRRTGLRSALALGKAGL